MAVLRNPPGSRIVSLWLGFGLGIAALSGAFGEGRADQVVLRGGGQIRGKVVADPNHRDRVLVLTERGKTPLSFQKPQILQVIPESSPLDEYVVRRGEARADADSQYRLGAWCEEHRLLDLAEIHYRAALAQDNTFAPAHQKLGHVLDGGRWLTPDERREAQGLVRYKGRWISKEERDRLEAQAARRVAQASWARRIRLLRQAIVGGSEGRGREAEQQLLEIRDPVAVAPLVRVLGEDAEALRILLDQVLGAIPGPEAAEALVHRILVEIDSDVRQVTLAQLEQRKDDGVVPRLVKALRSTSPEAVNRAAWALASLDAVAAVPRLVPALITTQYRVVIVASGGGSSGASFGSVPTNPALNMAAPLYANGSSLALLTPPAMGAGSVAYGATQVPYGSFVGTSASLGGGNVSRGPVPKLMAFSYQNVEVLAALVKLTGHDFGFDIPSWKRWVSTSFQPDPAPVRRVPQP